MANKTVERKIVMHTKEAENNISKLKTETRSLKLAFQKLVTNVQTTIDVMVNLSDYTDKLISSTRLLNTTFGSSSKELERFVENMAEMTGLDETSLTNKTALFGQMATSLGVAGDNAIELSKSLTTVATKLSLLYN